MRTLLHYLAVSVLPAIVNMSLAASVVVLFVLLMRLLLMRAPKCYSYLLWAAVFFRLLCPLSLTGRFSLFGVIDAPVKQQSVVTSSVAYVPAVQPPFRVEGMRAPAPYMNGAELAALLYLVGLTAIAAYSLWSSLHLRRRLQTAVPWRPGVFLADHLESPFVLGLLRPKIYLPSNLPEADRRFILLHERHHIHRGDQLFKALAFAALAIHWFNPLVWLAFFLLGKDMEMSCDEAVLSKLDTDIRADYSAVLLRLATGRPIIAGTPLAFGEGDARSRIKNVLNWKRPRTRITVFAALLCTLVLAFCLLNPQEAKAEKGSGPDGVTEGIPGPGDTVLPCDAELIRARGGILLPEDDPASYGQIDGAYYLMFIPKGVTNELWPAYKVGNPEELNEFERQQLDTLVDDVYPMNRQGKSYGPASLSNYVGYAPDLEEAIGTEGQKGYIDSRSFRALSPGEVTLPLYDAEGTIIGEFSAGGCGGGGYGRTLEEAKADVASGREEELNPAGIMEKMPQKIFGGLYFNEEHQLIVNVVEGFEGYAEELLQEEIKAGVILHSVPYSLSQLEGMKEALTPYMSEYHMVTLDANEQTNTVDITLNQESPRLEALLNSLEIVDADAVRIQILEGVELQYT